jgi:hypothetical protein
MPLAPKPASWLDSRRCRPSSPGVGPAAWSESGKLTWQHGMFAGLPRPMTPRQLAGFSIGGRAHPGGLPALGQAVGACRLWPRRQVTHVVCQTCRHRGVVFFDNFLAGGIF